MNTFKISRHILATNQRVKTIVTVNVNTVILPQNHSKITVEEFTNTVTYVKIL